MILDSFSVIRDQGWIVGFLFPVILSQTLISLFLRTIFGAQLTPNEYRALGIAGWILPVSLISLLPFLFGFEPASPFSLFLLLLLFCVPIFFLARFKPDPLPDSKSTAFFLLIFLAVSILLRLVFIAKAILPSYFDSAEHYRIIKHILENQTAGLIASLTSNYYHLGFHFIAAFVASVFQAEITKTMLVLGQMVLAFIPLAIFFPVKHETKSDLAGIFAVSLAAFGWYMPAHAMDWGKYPALTSLSMMPFVLSLAYLLARYKNSLTPQKRLMLYLLLGAGILISGFIHSRSLVILGIVFAAWTITAWQQKLPYKPRALIIVVTVAIVLETIYIQKQDILVLLFDPYLQKGMWITALVLFLATFAQRDYPQLTLTCLLTVCLLLGSLFMPVVGLIPGYENLTLLDRPFVEMVLFLPLTLLGGLGLAGLMKTLQNKNIRPSFAGLIAITLVLTNAFFTYDLHPSDCCVLVGNDDMAAIDWMDKQLSTDTRIGISATELKVLASESFEGYVGGDAGIWITPLINRGTIPLPYNTDFTEQATLDILCQLRISHLYVGELGQNFNREHLNAQTAWYKLLLSMPRVKVYQVVGCK